MNMDNASGKVCAFCGRGQNAQTVCGKLYSKQLTRVKIAAHKKCMQYSSKLNQNHDDDFGGFDIKDVRKEIQRGKKLFCSWCKQKKKRASGATSGCEWRKCRKTFHFYCAWQHPQSRTCRRRRRDTGEDIYWVFCSQEHKNEYLKTNEGRNEISCSETDDEDDQASRQHSHAQSRKADKVSGSSEEDESSDPDEIGSEDDGVEIASSSDSDQGSKSANGFMWKTSVVQEYDDEDGGQESGNKADLLDPDEHHQKKSATQATDSEEWRHSIESNASDQSKGEWRHSVDSNMSDQSNGEEAIPQIIVRKRKAVTSCEEKGEQPGCSTAKRIRSTAGPLQDRTTPDPARYSVQSSSDPPRHSVQSSSDPPRHPVQSSSETTGYQAPTHGNGVPGSSGDGLFQGLSPAASVSCGEAGVQHETEGISGPDSSPDANTCASPGHANAMDATAEDPGRLRADQTMTNGGRRLGADQTMTSGGRRLGADQTMTNGGRRLGADQTMTSGGRRLGADQTMTNGGRRLGADQTMTSGGRRLGADQTMTSGGRRLGADQTMTSGGRRLGADQMMTSGGRRLGADQTMTSGDLAASPRHETGLTSFSSMQDQCGTRTSDAEDESELSLQREYLRSEISRNNIVIQKVQKNMEWLEEKQKRKEEKSKREERQHEALMKKLRTEMALMEQRKNREEELHGVVVEKMKKELDVCDMTLKKIQEELALIEDRKKRGEEKRKREEESDKKEENMYMRLIDESSARQEYYNRHFNL